MTNLALGLAQLGFWLLSYTAVDRWIINLVGFNLRHFMALAVIGLLWATVLLLFKRMRVSVVVGPMYYVLAFSNVLSLLTLAVHGYNAFQLVESGGSMQTVEEIMAPRFWSEVEHYLRAAYPFARILLLVSTVALVVHVSRSFRRGAPTQPTE